MVLVEKPCMALASVSRLSKMLLLASLDDH